MVNKPFNLIAQKNTNKKKADYSKESEMITSCSEKWMPHSWKCSKPGWRGIEQPGQ